MIRKVLLAVLPLAIIIAIPVALRRTEVDDNTRLDQLVIISPHNEAIRFEFERAFREHCSKVLGKEVDIDWRTPGGTSEIVRFINSSYVAAFRQSWEAQGKRWDTETENAFMNRKLRQESASPEAWAAREMFLNGNAGIGVDVFFGGGQYDFDKMASTGVLVPCGLQERHPELFTGDVPVLSQSLSGEVWYDPEDRYYGACVSAFGICYNDEALMDLGYTVSPGIPPMSDWEDLAAPRLLDHIGAADPSKSGSITKCFEMLIQQSMAREVARQLPDGEDNASPEAMSAALCRGWQEAMLLVHKIGGISRYFTFSASKVPVDVAKGDIAAGMCIDFYGRSQAEWEEQHNGRQIMAYVTPNGGSSVSVDPVGILRGAPHRDLAEAFVDFVMSPKGQVLWNYRVGTEGGPTTYALRRLPVRRDVYGPENRRQMSDADADPFDIAGRFTYRGAWTGRYFDLIRILLRVMIIDCHPELRDAWRAIVKAGGPAAVPKAMAYLSELPFAYTECGAAADSLARPLQRIAATRTWGEFFRDRYRKAEAAARASSTDG